ncbi:MAG: hypothetical protein EBV45_14630, partial [Chloroflexi bacterium]|nr:hypothetical protein [Chloroflexota bacterium]
MSVKNGRVPISGGPVFHACLGPAASQEAISLAPVGTPFRDADQREKDCETPIALTSAKAGGSDWWIRFHEF